MINMIIINHAHQINQAKITVQTTINSCIRGKKNKKIKI